MTQYHIPEPEEHSPHHPIHHGDQRDPRRTGRPMPEVQPTLAVQRVAANQTQANRAVQRTVQRFLQRASGGSATVPRPDEDTGQRIQSMSGGGAGIDPSAKGKLEEGLSADLSGVRVHTGGEADKLARSVDAVAFTSGQDIFFREGAYNPGSQEGMRLLAHEATHTVQQAAGPVAGTPTEGGVSVSDPSDSFEQAASHNAERVVSQTTEQEQEDGAMRPVQRQRASNGATSVQRKAASAHKEALLAARNWPATLPRKGKKTSAPANAEQASVVDTLRRQREQLEEDSRLHLVNYGKRLNAGYMYNGKSQGDPDPTELMNMMGGSSEEKKRETQINWLVWSELKSEGGVASINTSDSQVLAWGSAFSGAGQLQEVMDTLLNSRGINDNEARDLFLDAGISLENGQLLVVDTSAGIVAEGRSALELLQFDKKLLSLFIAISEDPAHSQSVVDAQYRVFKRHAGKIPDFVHKEWQEDKDPSIALLAHISHWLPEYGWKTHPSEYQNTYGDMEKVLIAFGKLIGQRQGPSGAYIVAERWQILSEDHFKRFGEGIGAKGVAMDAFKGQSPLDLTDKDIASNESYRDHVFFPLGNGKGYFALPSVPEPLEKGAQSKGTTATSTNQTQASGDKNANQNKGQNQNQNQAQNKKGKSSK